MELLKWLSVGLYLSSFGLVAFKGEQKGTGLLGVIAFLLGALTIQFTVYTILAWFSNILFLIGFCLTFTHAHPLWIVFLAGLASVCSLGALKVQYIYANPMGMLPVKLGIGYYVWTSSFLGLFVYGILKLF